MFIELLKNIMNLGIITEDDVKRLTAIELMLLIVERINGLLLHVDKVDGKLDTLLEDVYKITIEELNKWTQDGTFDSLINQSALKEVNERIDETNEQLTDIELKMEVNIRDFGAKCDGITDDTQAIQSAINSLSERGGRVILPTGNIKVTSQIKFPTADISNFVTIKGAGKYSTLIRYYGSDDLFNAQGTKEKRINVSFEDFSMLNVGDSESCNGIVMNWNGVLSHLSNICVEGFYDGIKMANNWNISITNVTVQNNINCGFTRFGSINAINFNGGRFCHNGKYNIYLTGRNHILNNVDVTDGGESGLYAHTCYGLTLNSCYLENCGTLAGFYFESCRSIAINGIDVSVWRDGEKMLSALNSNGIVINGFCVENSDLYFDDTYGLYFDGCSGLLLNGLDIRQMGIGIYLKNSNGIINNPIFSKTVGINNIKILDHEYNQFTINIKEQYIEKMDIGLTASKYTKINVIDQRFYGSQSTGDLPLNPTIGQSFFEQSLGKPIFYRGNDCWVDATGTVIYLNGNPA